MQNERREPTHDPGGPRARDLGGPAPPGTGAWSQQGPPTPPIPGPTPPGPDPDDPIPIEEPPPGIPIPPDPPPPPVHAA